MQVQAKDFRPTPFDSPIGVFLPEDRQDWIVVETGHKELADRNGTEVHRFRHWSVPSIYVRIKPPQEK